MATGISHTKGPQTSVTRAAPKAASVTSKGHRASPASAALEDQPKPRASVTRSRTTSISLTQRHPQPNVRNTSCTAGRSRTSKLSITSMRRTKAHHQPNVTRAAPKAASITSISCTQGQPHQPHLRISPSREHHENQPHAESPPAECQEHQLHLRASPSRITSISCT